MPQKLLLFSFKLQGSDNLMFLLAKDVLIEFNFILIWLHMWGVFIMGPREKNKKLK